MASWAVGPQGLGSATFCGAIQLVFAVRPCPQMGGIHAARIVARMADVKAHRYRPIDELKGEPMREPTLPTVAKVVVSVALPIARAPPFPTP